MNIPLHEEVDSSMVLNIIRFLCDKGYISVPESQNRDRFMASLRRQCENNIHRCRNIDEQFIKSLTTTQKKTVAYICVFRREYRISPTVRDIMTAFGISVQAAHDRILSLEHARIITRMEGQIRGITPIDPYLDSILSDDEKEEIYLLVEKTKPHSIRKGRRKEDAD